MGSPRVIGQDVEEAGLGWLASSGFVVAQGLAIAFGQPSAERSDPMYRDVILEWRSARPSFGP
jgi:type I restriction enzyme R subunit